MSTKKVFRSRISVLLIIFILAMFIPISIPIFQNKVYPGMYVLGGTFFFIMFICIGMRYIISGNNLFLKFWFINLASINIANIRSVKRSYNPLSSPAASLKRLEVSFKKNTRYSYTLISPVREQKFIDELKVINPNIDVNIPEKKGRLRIWDWDI